MPELRISIGGRDFDVACQAGEEQFLRSAAAMLDKEATALAGQIGKMPDVRMLLMAGLLVADRAAGNEDKLRQMALDLEARQALPAASEEEIAAAAETAALARQAQADREAAEQMLSEASDLSAQAQAMQEAAEARMSAAVAEAEEAHALMARAEERAEAVAQQFAEVEALLAQASQSAQAPDMQTAPAAEVPEAILDMLAGLADQAEALAARFAAAGDERS